VSVTKSHDQVPAPTEQVGESFEAQYPCDRSFTVSYDRLVGWWVDYVDCKLNKSQDCDLLLTTDSGGGVNRHDRYAVSSRGGDIASLSASYEIQGCQDGHGGMQTAMHETAHGFMTEGSQWEHNSGHVFDSGSNNYRTLFGSGGENECGYSSPDRHMVVSECDGSKTAALIIGSIRGDPNEAQSFPTKTASYD